MPSDEQLVQDYSVIKTCGSEDAARDSLQLLKSAIDSGNLSLLNRDLHDEPFMRILKAIGIFGKLMNLLPMRTSVLPIKEVNFSGNVLLMPTSQAFTGAPEVSARSLQPLQLAVQFVRVSTDARAIFFENCNLQGTTHDKDDKVEQEVIRLVKKFGAGKESRYARELSLAGNKFESEFAKKLIEAAYWERGRHPDKEHPPKLFLNLRRNRIRNARKVIEELKAGQTAGGAVDVASAEESEQAQDKALIVVDMDDQVDRSVTPIKGNRERLIDRDPPRRSSPLPPCRSSPPPKYSRSPSPRGSCRRQPSPSRSFSRRRDVSQTGGGARRRSRSRQVHNRGGPRDGGIARRQRGGAARGGRSPPEAYSEGDSRNPTPPRGGRGPRRMRRRRARREPSPLLSEDSRDESRPRSHNHGDGGRRQRRRRRH